MDKKEFESFSKDFQRDLVKLLSEYNETLINVTKPYVIDLSYEALKRDNKVLDRDNYILLMKQIYSPSLPIFTSFDSIDPNVGLYVVQVFPLHVLVARDYDTISKYATTRIEGFNPKSAEILDKVLLAPTNPIVQKHLEVQLNRIQSVQGTVDYKLQDIDANQLAEFKKSIGGSYIAVHLQGGKRSQQLIKKAEKKIVELCVKYSHRLPATEAKTADEVVDMIVGILSGKQKKTTKRTFKTTKSVSSTPKVKARSKEIKVNLRDLAGRFTSVTNLTNLINTALHDQIKRNMGTGNSKTVLNYRTGRFARSVEVERITQSREGMLTAFYNYMKYPYQTFQKGFAQGHIASRDPKLLISKSIREIAANLVKNKMRSVLV